MIVLVVPWLRDCVQIEAWPRPLSGIAAAGGIAMINAVGNPGGFLGPYMFRLIKDSTGNDMIALLALACAPAMCTVILMALGHDRRLEQAPVAAE